MMLVETAQTIDRETTEVMSKRCCRCFVASIGYYSLFVMIIIIEMYVFTNTENANELHLIRLDEEAKNCFSLKRKRFFTCAPSNPSFAYIFTPHPFTHHLSYTHIQDAERLCEVN